MMLTETISMAHLGARAFEEIGGEVVQTTAFVRCANHVEGYKGTYCRLIEPTSQQGKEEMFLAGQNRYTANQDDFAKIPGASVAYWVSKKLYSTFRNSLLYDYTISDGQNKTGDNAKFVREFWEVRNSNVGKGKKWLFYAKGGGYRKWYGNLSEVVNWSEEAREFYKNDKICRIIPEYLWYKAGITWSLISNNPSFRLLPEEATFDVGGSSIFLKDNSNIEFVLGLLNSKVFSYVQKIVNPTINIQVKDIRVMPFVKKNENEITGLAEECSFLSKEDWDSFETSWDFTRHPFIKAITKYPNMMDIGNIYLAECYDIWAGECEERFEKLKANEEELNRIFIDIYGLQDELTPEVEDKDVTVRKADLGRDVRSFISYAVGCMFGRYSPTYDGLAYAGGTWDDGKYNIYKPDADGIIPICDDEYFEDDMMGRFVEFVRVVYGDGSLEDNLRFIANALGGKGQPKEVIRNYFLNDFYADHCKIYQKRPIYWLFDSGKKNGFKCLIYLHRYQPDTIARIRTDYVHEQQARYRTAIEDLEKQVAAATSTSERVKLTKQLNKVQAQDAELHQYEEKVHALADQMIKIDLDDGVKHNYEIFKDVLAKIK